MTLIEVMVAGALFGVGVAATATSVNVYMAVLEHERKLASAWRILQGEAAHVRALPLTSPTWTSSTSAKVNAFGMLDANGPFVVKRTPAANTPFQGATQLTLDVSWSEPAGVRSATLVVRR
jgi:hypothetical protein